MEIEFKTKNPKQIEAVESWLDDTVEELLYGGAKGGGKSYLGASLIFGDALTYDGTSYFIARKELNDLRKFTIPTIHEVFSKGFKLKLDDYASFNGQDNAFYLKNGSIVYLIACKEEPSDPLFERFGSMQMTRGWIEEGGEVNENAKANLSLAIGRWKNVEYNLSPKLLITANPKKGWMKREFIDPFKEGKLHKSKRFISAKATDNVYLDERYVDKLRNEKNAVRRQRLWDGDWDYDDDKNSLITFDALTDTFSNTIVKDGQKYMTVDVARKGRDSTVISIWDGLELINVDVFEKKDTFMTEQNVKDRAAKYSVPFSHIIIDEDGIGGGVVDHLYGVKGFVANSSPISSSTEIRDRKKRMLNPTFVPKVNFANLKSQCGWKLAELINEHKIKFNVPDSRENIILELSAILKDGDIDGEGKLQIISKDDVKKEIGKSPDIGDSILFRMWFELIKDALPSQSGENLVLANKLQNQFELKRAQNINRNTH